MIIERRPLRADVGAEILGRIIDGRLPSGTRINESHLALDLGISRTPLREAMLCLVTEGALGADMGRGFKVPHLVGREVVELLETLAVLLPTAVRQGGPFEIRDQVEARNLLARARLHAGEPTAFCEHCHLLLRRIARQSANATLVGECDRMAQLLLRYLHEALRRGWNPGQALGDLEQALQVLQQGERAGAAAMIERACLRAGGDLAAFFPAVLEARA
jgi:DNA-binding GntR family transcriptional regulator